jgi:hypothetical protein
MKIKYLILTILALALIHTLGFSAKTDKISATDSVFIHKQALKTVTIVPPHSEIYDDGILKKSFVGYNLSDINDNLLIKVGTVQDIPVTLKIEEGTYIIRLNEQNPTSFYITVSAEQAHLFRIP